jgi:hypothetical protein
LEQARVLAREETEKLNKQDEERGLRRGISPKVRCKSCLYKFKLRMSDLPAFPANWQFESCPVCGGVLPVASLGI